MLAQRESFHVPQADGHPIIGHWTKSLRRRLTSLPRILKVRALHAVEAKAVTGATRAAKDLRRASMNFANWNRFALSLSALFAPARTVDKSREA